MKGTTAILTIAVIALLILYISTKLSLTAYIAWIEENHFRHPTEADMYRLMRWCAKNYLKDLFGKS